jgi:hypothetical protein
MEAAADAINVRRDSVVFIDLPFCDSVRFSKSRENRFGCGKRSPSLVVPLKS